MISDVDEALRQILKQDFSIGKYDIDIRYDQPNRDWTSRLNRPTINLFLFDIRENLKLRGAEQFRAELVKEGTFEVRRNPIRIDLRYLLTAWTKDPEDEHLLLSDALISLLQNPILPQSVLSDRLKVQPFPIPLETAVFQPEHGPMDKFTEIWNVLNNEIHAGFIVTITIAVDPFKPDLYGEVRSMERRYGQRVPNEEKIAAVDPRITNTDVRCRIISEKKSVSTLKAVLAETKEPLEISEKGEITLRNIASGTYHIKIFCNGKVIKQQVIEVPSGEMDIHL